MAKKEGDCYDATWVGTCLLDVAAYFIIHDADTKYVNIYLKTNLVEELLWYYSTHSSRMKEFTPVLRLLVQK